MTDKNFLIVLLLLFPVLLFAQEQIIKDYFFGVTIGVRADQGEPGMHAKVTDVDIEHAGYYQVYPKILYNSGDDQLNETFYMTLEHGDGTDSTPEDANAGPYKVVLDDPGPPHTAWRDAGLFYFEEGINTLHLHHYAAISNQYPQFLNGPIIHTESVKIIDSLRLISKPFIDAGVKVHSTPPRLVTIEDETYGVAYADERISYDIVVRNDYINTIRHATLINVPTFLLIDTTYSPSPSGQEDGRSFWNLPDIAPGDSFVVTLDANTPAEVPDGLNAILDSAWVHVINDIDSTNNMDIDTSYTSSEAIGEDPLYADIRASLFSQTDSVLAVDGKERHYAHPGEAVSYRLQLQNAGPDTAEQVIWNHLLPQEFIYLSASTTPDTVVGDTLKWFFPSMQMQTSETIIVNGFVKNSFTQIDTVMVSSTRATALNDTLLDNNSDRDSVYIYFPDGFHTADLQVDLVAQTDTSVVHENRVVKAAVEGSQYSYELTIQNNGPQTSRRFWLQHILPDSVTVMGWSLVPTMTNEDTLFWQIDSLPALDLIKIDVQVSVADTFPAYPWEMPSSALVKSNTDTVSENNQAHESVYAIFEMYAEPEGNTDVKVDLYSLTDTTVVFQGKIMNAVRPGEAFQYIIRLDNIGPERSDTVQVIQRYPGYIEFIDASLSPVLISEEDAIWRVPHLGSGEETNIVVDARLRGDIPYDIGSRNSRVIISADNDTSAANNTDSDSVGVIHPLPGGQYDITVDYDIVTDNTSVIQGDTVAAVYPGEDIVLRIGFTNRGPEAAYNVNLYDILPDSIQVNRISLQPEQTGTETVFWRLDTLEVAQTGYIDIESTVAPRFPYLPYELTSTVYVESAEDTTSDNDSASVRFYALPTPAGGDSVDVEIELTSITDTTIVYGGQNWNAAQPGEPFTYEIRVTNHGPYDVRNVDVEQGLPANLAYQTTTLFPEAVTADSIFWTIDRLDAGNDTSWVVFVKADGIPSQLQETVSVAIVSVEKDSVRFNNTDADTMLVYRSAFGQRNYDLSIAKKAVADTHIVVFGDTLAAMFTDQSFLYRIEVTNHGPGTAFDIEIRDILPDSLIFNRLSVEPYRRNQDTLYWKIDSLKAMDSFSIDIDAQSQSIYSYYPYELINSAHLFASGDTTADNNQALISVFVLSDDLRPRPTFNRKTDLIKTATWDDVDDNGLITSGDLIEYTIEIINSGNGAASGVVFTDSIPAHTTLSRGPTATAGEILSSSPVRIDIGTMQPRDTVRIAFSVEVISRAATIINQGLLDSPDIHEPEPTDDPATPDEDDPTVVEPSPGFNGSSDLIKRASWQDQDNNGRLTVGDIIDYEVEITNSGHNSANDVVFFDTLPDNTVLYGELSTSKGKIISTSPVQVEIGLIVPGESVNIAFSVQLIADMDKVVNQGELDIPDTDEKEPTDDPTTPEDDDPTITEPSANFDGAADVIKVDVWHDKDGDKQLSSGDVIDYTVTIHNSGGRAAADVVFSDPLPSNTNLSGTVTTTRGEVVSTTPVRVNIGIIAAGETVTIRFSVKVEETVSQILNQGEIDSPDIDEKEPTDDPSTPDEDDPTITEPIPNFDGSADVIKSDVWHDRDDNGELTSGDVIDYTVTIYNSGGRAADSVVFRDPVPANTALSGTVSTTQGKVVSTDPVQVNVGTILPTESVTIRFSVKVSKTVSQIINQGQIESPDLPNPEPTNDPDTSSDDDPTLTEPGADFSGYADVTKTDLWHDLDDNGVLSAGDVIDYTIAITNSGGRHAENVLFMDPLPVNTSLQGTVTASKGEVISTSPIRVSIKTLGSKESVTIRFSLKINGNVAQIVNQGTVSSSSTDDPETTDDPDTAGEDDPTVTEPDPDFSGSNDVIKQGIWNDLDDNDILSADDLIEYSVIITNSGLGPADSVVFIDTLPANTSLHGSVTTTHGKVVSTSPIEVNIGQIDASETVTIHFTIRLNTTVDMVTNQGQITAAEFSQPILTDDPNTNQVDDPTIIIGRAANFTPLIEATPTVVDVTDSVQVRVQVPVKVSSWDLWVYLPDGSVNKSFADHDIASTRLTPDIWHLVDDLYYPQKLVTTERQEELIFEIRATDAWGRLATARTSVLVKSGNYLVLDRNVFKAEYEAPLQIHFKLSYRRVARLDIYDTTGRHMCELTEDVYDGGWNVYYWNGLLPDGQKAGSGVYLVTLRSGEYNSWKKFIIVR